MRWSHTDTSDIIYIMSQVLSEKMRIIVESFRSRAERVRRCQIKSSYVHRVVTFIWNDFNWLIITKQRRLEQPPTPAEDTEGEEEPVVVFTIVMINRHNHHHPHQHHRQHHHQHHHHPPSHQDQDLLQAGPRLILDDFTDSLYASKSTIAFGVSSDKR